MQYASIEQPSSTCPGTGYTAGQERPRLQEEMWQAVSADAGDPSCRKLRVITGLRRTERSHLLSAQRPCFGRRAHAISPETAQGYRQGLFSEESCWLNLGPHRYSITLAWCSCLANPA